MLQSYARALELQPGRVYCLIQSGALKYQLGELEAAATMYARCVRLCLCARDYLRACETPGTVCASSIRVYSTRSAPKTASPFLSFC